MGIGDGLNVVVKARDPQEARPNLSSSTHVRKERLLHLDGLRGLAVLLVFFVHLHPLFSRFLMQNSISYAFSGVLACIGNAGVDLFFLLSGYLIYGVVLKHAPTYGSFLRRRVRRTYPTFIFVLGLYLLLSLLFPVESKLYGSTSDKLRYVAVNLCFLPGVFPIRPIITVAWSLSYEFFFYLAIPIIVHMTLVRKKSPEQRVALFAAWWFVGTIVLRFAGMQRLQMFVVGIIIYELSQIQDFTRWLNTTGECFATLVFFFGLTCAYFLFVATSQLIASRSFGRYLAFPLMSASFFFFGLYALLYPGFLRTALMWAPFRLLGRVSYSYYLIHGLTLKALALVLIIISVRWMGATVFWMVSAVGFVLTCLTASLLYLIVEEPLSLHTDSTLLRVWRVWRREAEYETNRKASAVAASSVSQVPQLKTGTE